MAAWQHQCKQQAVQGHWLLQKGRAGLPGIIQACLRNSISKDVITVLIFVMCAAELQLSSQAITESGAAQLPAQRQPFELVSAAMSGLQLLPCHVWIHRHSTAHMSSCNNHPAESTQPGCVPQLNSHSTDRQALRQAFGQQSTLSRLTEFLLEGKPPQTKQESETPQQAHTQPKRAEASIPIPDCPASCPKRLHCPGEDHICSQVVFLKPAASKEDTSGGL